MGEIRKILITGGAGYVGSTLVGLLLDEGHKVRVVDKLMHDPYSLASYTGNPNFEFIFGDLNERLVRERAIVSMDSVVHLAAIVGDPACSRHPEYATKNNYDLTMELTRIAKDNGVQRFIFSSTCSNYGVKTNDEFCTEETSLNPVSTYAVSKVKSEDFLLKETTKYFYPTILRFSTIFGVSPRMRFDLLVNDFTKEAVTRGKLVVYGEQFWRPYLHVCDISRAVSSVLKTEDSIISGQIFNVGNNTLNYMKKDIAALIRDVFPNVEIVFVKKDKDIRSYRVDFSKIERLLGFLPTLTIRDGINEVKYVLESRIINNPNDMRYYN